MPGISGNEMCRRIKNNIHTRLAVISICMMKQLSITEYVINFNQKNFSIKRFGKNPDFNIEQLASEVCMGRSAFFEKIKDITGTTPANFQNDS